MEKEDEEWERKGPLRQPRDRSEVVDEQKPDDEHGREFEAEFRERGEQAELVKINTGADKM